MLQHRVWSVVRHRVWAVVRHRVWAVVRHRVWAVVRHRVWAVLRHGVWVEMNDNEILKKLITTKFWKPIGSSKLTRHPRWDFFAPVNSTGRGVPPLPSTSRLQLLCQGFPVMRESNRQRCNWLMRPAQAETLAPRPLAGMGNMVLMQECFVKHSWIGTRMKQDKETNELQEERSRYGS